MADRIPARVENFITNLVTNDIGMLQFAEMRKSVQAFNKEFGTKFFLTKSPRLGVNNPNAVKYAKRGPAAYQMIKIGDSHSFDVYLRDRSVYGWYRSSPEEKAKIDFAQSKFNELKADLTRR